MGNSSTKEESRHSIFSSSAPPESSSAYSHHRERHSISHPARPSGRHDVSFFGIGGQEYPSPELRRETKQERDARRAERDRLARLKERERSLKEEGVDGGYLVTLGTYTGPEDFSKPIVRQLMIERRVAPFWRGLNDHSESWTEHQLVAAARGLPIPAPDEIPSEDIMPSATPTEPNSSSKPIPVYRQGQQYYSPEYSSTFFASHPSFASNDPSSTNSSPSATSPLFRGRSKTLASLSSKTNVQADLTPQEIRLPYQPQINGQPVEAYLYKDVMECPICFLYYPPYLNRTRCCDQPICSECFVQIKRPDPHPPEHLDPNVPPAPEAKRQEEEGLLVAEPASCPFCVQTDFGITYEPPPFRRGLAYPNSHPVSGRATPSDGGSTSTATRRRGQSISASDSSVITTDKVRPDWARKLAEARAHAARRSAAATALHTAAYLMNNNMPESRMGFGRRRRYLINPETPEGSQEGNARSTDGTPVPNMEALMAALEGQSSSSRVRESPWTENTYNRLGSRGNRTEELEELMVMEAIRLSLAAEEERKKKEEKDAAKEAKKEEKKKAKEQKKADKAGRKGSLYTASANASSSQVIASSANNDHNPDPGKGKAKAAAPEDSTPPSINTLGFSILDEPTSTLNNEARAKPTNDSNAASADPEPKRPQYLSPEAAANQSTAPPSSTNIASSTAPQNPEDSKSSWAAT